ncbi:DUF1772 domain-containing protein [soil metagenome]
MTGITKALTIAGAVGAAVSGGVFFAFSTFVMKGLRDLPAPQGIAAMQAINRAAPSPLFMTALFGTAAISFALAVVAVRRLGQTTSVYLLVGGALYLVVIVLTAAYHVPRNDALALIDPTDPGAARVWVDYARDWTLWNHLRTLCSIGAALAFTLSLN